MQESHPSEWLLTNGLGGFAMGSLEGVPTRRYHAWLVASQRPPLDRVVALHSIADWLETDGQMTWLSAYRFEDGSIGPGLAPDTSESDGDRWNASWRIGEAQVGRSVRIVPGANRIEVAYVWRRLPERTTIRLRPLVPLRDFHALERDVAPPQADIHEDSVILRRELLSLRIDLPKIAQFERHPDIWHGLRYEDERSRGYDWLEDLPSPGVIELIPEDRESGRATLIFELEPVHPPVHVHPKPDADGTVTTRLARAAGDFVVRRGPSVDRADGWSILAGYPWFSDWGRDTMIALPGLLLIDERYDEAIEVLRTFAEARRDGLIPNRFSDDGVGAEYNTADASLWFLHAATEWALASGHTETFRDVLLPACEDIIDWHIRGTGGFDGFKIVLDPADGLIDAGDEHTQLTWMDARRDGVVFTPRHGKPIELSALWQHGLERVAALTGKADRASRYRELAALARISIANTMFDPARGWCADRLERTARGWQPVWELRPNQLLAASLEHGCLPDEAARSLVDACVSKLWTPRGVRTLSPEDPMYRGRFEGPIFERDAAYHQGTAWPWLLGPMCEAVLRADSFSGASRARARSLLEPMLSQLDGPCPGQLYEVYDGDGWSGTRESHTQDARPQQPGGCPAQAWSVSEIRRVLAMIEGASQPVS